MQQSHAQLMQKNGKNTCNRPLQQPIVTITSSSTLNYVNYDNLHENNTIVNFTSSHLPNTRPEVSGDTASAASVSYGSSNQKVTVGMGVKYAPIQELTS